MSRNRSATGKVLAAIGGVLLVAALGPPALAAGGTKAQVEMWKANCKVCHQPKGQAKALSPSTLIGMQWERFFAKKFAKSHAELIHPEKNQPLGKVLTPELLDRLEKFLVDHAADSEQPMTCGK